MQKYIYILLVVFSSCIKEYNPDISKYENVFVVDGKLTNLPGPYVVKLSRSYRFEENAGQPVGGAQLKIVDDTGIETELEEQDKGVYVTTDNTFRGVAGKSYKLQIMLDDELYESEMETLIEPVAIDSIFWEFKKDDNDRNGIQLLINTHDPHNKTRYYGWEYVDTWKYIVPIDHPDHPDRREGYASSANYYYNIATTIHRNTDIVEKQPLQFISENVNKLYIRYSILVTQYAFTDQTYKYFKDLVTINQDQGSLFDPTPHSHTGNIKNLSNKNLPVLGYFMVAGATEKRIFIDRSELPKEYRPRSGFEDCYQENAIVKWEYRNNYRQDRIVDSLMNHGFTIITQAMEAGVGRDTLIHLSLAKRRCYDSRASGTNIKPDFWTDK